MEIGYQGIYALKFIARINKYIGTAGVYLAVGNRLKHPTASGADSYYRVKRLLRRFAPRNDIP